ncbi:MAG: tRNA 2-thiouridine(34) synthase MnmA, partial [Eubacteriales bacterium]|nr:tRNA 2-thiouridine(34) synthase MnmA [Eubacteriales bacterium]
MQELKKKKVMLGLSGGVDSALSASLLLEQGFEVIGLTLVFSCRSEEARDNMLNDAKSLASFLGIEHLVYEARSEFADKVLAPFVEAWRLGETPNPCVLCNPVMKFPSIIALADE